VATLSSGEDSAQSKRTYFEVEVNRSVEIVEEVRHQWRARNVPILNGVNIHCDITAKQDLELLYFTFHISLTFLHPAVLEKRQQVRAQAHARNIRIANHRYDDNRFDDKHIAEKEIALDDDLPFEDDPDVELHNFQITFGLTGDEMLVFGTGETLDEKKARSKRDQDYSSNSFMKNVLNRMHLVFKGSSTDPFDTSCYVTDEAKWEIKYSRRLLRDVRTISGGVMVVTASGYGGEILYEAESMDTLIYSKVCNLLSCVLCLILII
jgi:hypothetical protein